MFRIVADFVPQPNLLLLCDDRHCGCFATAVLPAGLSEEERNATVTPFIQGAINAGWAIGIDRHLCPQHAGRIAQGRKLVEVPQFTLN